MKKVFTGSNLNQLYQLLEETQEACHPVIQNQKFKLLISRNSENWSVEGEVKGASGKSLVKSQGSSLKKLIYDLTQFDEVGTSNMVVLAHIETEPETDYYLVRSKWAVIDPLGTAEFLDDRGEFPIKTLELTRREFNAMMETRLALYDERTDKIYAIKNQAINSIGSLTKASVLFRNLQDKTSMLGVAFVLAEAIGEAFDLNVLCKPVSDQVYGLTSFINGRSSVTNWVDYVCRIVNTCEDTFPCTVNRYEVNDDEIVIDIALALKLGKIKIIISTLPGKADYATLYSEFSGVPVNFMTNRLRQEKRTHPEILFEGMDEAYEAFAQKLDSLPGKPVTSVDASMIRRIIGRTRFAETNWDNLPADDAFLYFFDAIKDFPDLSDRKREMLFDAYGEIFMNL